MKTFVVLGMHRSGTSAVAGTLHFSGVHMGDRTTAPWFANLKGGYEDIEWVKVNARILAHNHGEWYKPPAKVEVDSALVENIKSQARKSAEGRQRWGFKDPRTALTIHVIHPHLKNPQYIIVTRPIEAICRSLVTRNGNQFTMESALALTGSYLLHIGAFLFSVQSPRLWVDYDKLLDGDQDTVRALAKFIDGPVDTSFLDATLRHQT